MPGVMLGVGQCWEHLYERKYPMLLYLFREIIYLAIYIFIFIEMFSQLGLVSDALILILVKLSIPYRVD